MKDFLIICFLFFVNSAICQSTKKILDKYFKSVGGVEAWQNIKTIKIIQQDESSDDYSKKIKENKDFSESLNNNYIQTISIDFEKKCTHIEIAFNNSIPVVSCITRDSGWKAMNPIRMLTIIDKKSKTGIFDLSYKEVRERRDATDIFFGLFPRPNCDTSFIYNGKVFINGNECFELKENTSSKRINTYYISTKSFELMRIKNEDVEVNYKDYRQIGDIKFPFHKELIVNHIYPNTNQVTQYTENYLVLSINLNVEFDKKKFLKPLN